MGSRDVVGSIIAGGKKYYHWKYINSRKFKMAVVAQRATVNATVMISKPSWENDFFYFLAVSKRWNAALISLAQYTLSWKLNGIRFPLPTYEYKYAGYGKKLQKIFSALDKYPPK